MPNPQLGLSAARPRRQQRTAESAGLATAPAADKELHVAVDVVRAVAATACRAHQVIEKLHAQPQVQLAVAELRSSAAEGAGADGA